MARHGSPSNISTSPRSPRVSFAEGLITSVCRPLRSSEHWTLYYFETHAANCKHCFEPLSVSRLGKQLCEEGNELAVDVARLIFCRRDGSVYSREKEGSRDVRVELPHNYAQTMGLLMAIQRALRKGQTFIKPRSQDRSYYVPERRSRTPEIISRTPEPMPRYEVREATPSPDRVKPRSDREDQDDYSKLRRGSLYGSDMMDIERAKREARATLRYNLEVREPSYLRSRRRFSISG